MDVRAIYSLSRSPRKADEKLTKTDTLASSWSSLLGVCVCQVFISLQRKRADVSRRWEALEMLNGVSWNPPTLMGAHINSGVGQRFHLWWQPESGPVRLPLRGESDALMTLCSVSGDRLLMHAAIHMKSPKRQRNEELDIELQLNVQLCEKALSFVGKGLCCLEMLHSPNHVDAMATRRLSLNKGW